MKVFRYEGYTLAFERHQHATKMLLTPTDHSSGLGGHLFIPHAIAQDMEITLRHLETMRDTVRAIQEVEAYAREEKLIIDQLISEPRREEAEY